MPYRGPQPLRINLAATDVFKHAGQTALWRQFISATSGNVDMGLGTTMHYREQLITGVFSTARIVENQQAAGLILAGAASLTTTIKLAADDEIRWRGEEYRVATDPQRSPITNLWTTEIQRGY